MTAAACAAKTEVVSGGTGAGGSASTSENGGGTTGTTATGTSTTSKSSGTGGGPAGIDGGKMDTLSFAIVGDTRPPNADDVMGYPTAVITKIWQDVEALTPKPPFAVTTGDYMFASTSSTVDPQLALYLGARANFSNVVYPAMGNHECNGATDSDCGAGNKNGITTNYNAFMTKMIMPLGVTEPYYMVDIASTTGAWTAKLVFIAANAWSTAQGTWLDAVLGEPTTYTFVIRHESVSADTAPGVTPSEAIIAKHPYTLKIVGHTHTWQYSPQDREVIVGNGGAPLSGGVDYGYTVATQRADGAMVFKSYDYMTNANVMTFAVTATGTPTN